MFNNQNTYNVCVYIHKTEFNDYKIFIRTFGVYSQNFCELSE